ncbi:MAG: hypothetical protein K2J40_00920 [Ruminococcus sp.]|nr:hypothetical protein [Ruminococcus sp.]
MRKFWGFYKNESYNVGCSGGTVYIYDSNGTELKKFRDFPYAYKAAFMPDSNIIAVKSTAGYIGFYDLEKLSLIKKHIVTRRGAQDEGFVFSSDGKFFYNIEKPILSTQTQLGIYETASFNKINTLFADNKKMVLQHLEIDKETGICYVLGFMRDGIGIFDYGFAGVFDYEKQIIDNIRVIDKGYGYLKGYKDWELSGFTDKSLEWNYSLKDLEEIKPITIREVFERV